MHIIESFMKNCTSTRVRVFYLLRILTMSQFLTVALAGLVLQIASTKRENVRLENVNN